MGFGGQGAQEKANDTAIGNINSELTDLSKVQYQRGGKAFKWAKKSLLSARDFWDTLLKGDRNATAAFLSPELGDISKGYQQQRNAMAEFGPRGGGSNTAIGNLGQQQASDVNRTIMSARPMAADKLTSLGSIFGGMSQGLTGQAFQGYGQASQNLFGLNQEQEDVRARKAQAWSGLGQGAGSIAGGFLGGK